MDELDQPGLMPLGSGTRSGCINWQDSAEAFQAPNRANNLRFTFYSNGFSVEARDPRRPDGLISNWSADFAVESYGTGERLQNQPFAAIKDDHATLAVESVDVNYTNTVEGLQQTFLVKQRSPVGRLQIQMLLFLNGVYVEADNEKAGITFRDAISGETVMHYTDLHAFDATGRELPSMMVLGEENSLTLDVDDSGAVYPVLVDPWTWHNPSFNGTPQASAQFGYSLAYYERALSGSYFGSVIVGAPYFDNGQTDEGRVFPFLSDGNGIPSTANWTSEPNVAYANFGHSLAVAQPFDPHDNAVSTFQSEGTAFADLVVGADNYNNAVGRVYVFYGNSSGINSTADKTYDGSEANGAHFGYSLAVGDFPDDGFQDLAIGQPYAGGYGITGGKVLIYNGSSTGLPSSSSDNVSGEAEGDLFGNAIAFAGDLVSGSQSYGDLLVGSPGYNSGRGKVYLYRGNSTGTVSTPAWTYAGTQNSAELGASLAGNVDVDSNGKRDFVVGEPLYDYDGSTLNSGRIAVFRVDSSGNPPSTPDFLDGGHQAGAWFGYSLAMGPINRNTDGIGEIIVGVPRWDTNSNDDKGKVFGYWGRSGQSPNPTPDSFDSGQGTLTGEYFGFSVLWIRKITSGDDLPCVAAGGPRATQSGNSLSGIISLYQYGP
jgi:hypothetical protein